MTPFAGRALCFKESQAPGGEWPLQRREHGHLVAIEIRCGGYRYGARR
jgi:hypothetical protein